MKRYAFYEHGKKIGEFELYGKKDAQAKADELMISLSYGMKNPEVTYREIDDEQKKI